MNVRLTPRTEADISDAYTWYRHRRPHLAYAFLAAVQASIEAVSELPASFPVVQRGTRRALVRRFPYGLLYVVRADEAVVVGCFHLARDPRSWQDRISR